MFCYILKIDFYCDINPERYFRNIFKFTLIKTVCIPVYAVEIDKKDKDNGENELDKTLENVYQDRVSQEKAKHEIL